VFDGKLLHKKIYYWINLQFLLVIYIFAAHPH
jgi:hypothetical protein